MKNTSIGLCLLLFLGISCQSQAPLKTTHTIVIDQLFDTWNQPNHPGGSISVMKNGELIYSKAFGLASLEYDIPNEPNTVYNIASVSKQFTSMGILLLEKEGKLSIDEDIRTYLPDLPDFGEKITIRHCMHHTSGMRSLHALLGMAGWRGDDSRTNADLYRFMKQGKDLNFKPGAEYLYCNTGYMLMADIIEQLTGERFVDWIQQNVFQPLAMNATYVENHYNRVMPNNATSYNGTAKTGYAREIEFWGYVGSGNIHSNTQDLLNWMHQYYQPNDEWTDLFTRMQTVDVLNNGDTLYYAFGIDTKDYKGEKRIGHGGSIGGFRSHAVSFPEHQLDIVVLTNFSSAGAGAKALQIADVLLEKKATPRNNRQTGVPENYIDLPLDELKDYVGTYYSPELDTHYHFKLVDNQLKGNHVRHGDFEFKILNKDNLEASLGVFKDIQIKRREDNEIEGIYVTNGRVRNMWFYKTH